MKYCPNPKCRKACPDEATLCNICSTAFSSSISPPPSPTISATQARRTLAKTFTSVTKAGAVAKANEWSTRNNAKIVNVTLTPPENGWHTATLVYEIDEHIAQQMDREKLSNGATFVILAALCCFLYLIYQVFFAG